MIEALLAPPATAQQPLSPAGYVSPLVAGSPATMSNCVYTYTTTGGALVGGQGHHMIAVAGTRVFVSWASYPTDWRVEATQVIGQLALEARLSPGRIGLARRVFHLLQLWDVPAPTEVGDPSDDDFSLVWRSAGGLAASLVINEEKVLGYVYHPGLREPWMFAQPGIEVADLNAFARKVGSARAADLGRP